MPAPSRRPAAPPGDGPGGVNSAEDYEPDDRWAAVVHDNFKDPALWVGLTTRSGIGGDLAFKTAFARRARKTPIGQSLRDFDLRTRLFKHRCSYLIHTPFFQNIPSVLKTAIVQRLHRALDSNRADPLSIHLPPAEKTAITQIIKATLPRR